MFDDDDDFGDLMITWNDDDEVDDDYNLSRLISSGIRQRQMVSLGIMMVIFCDIYDNYDNNFEICQ